MSIGRDGLELTMSLGYNWTRRTGPPLAACGGDVDEFLCAGERFVLLQLQERFPTAFPMGTTTAPFVPSAAPFAFAARFPLLSKLVRDTDARVMLRGPRGDPPAALEVSGQSPLAVAPAGGTLAAALAALETVVSVEMRARTAPKL